MLIVFFNFSVIGWRDKLPQTSSFQITLGPVVQLSCHFLLRGSSQPKDQSPTSYISCIAGRVCLLLRHCACILSHLVVSNFLEVSRQECQSGVSIFYSWGSSQPRAQTHISWGKLITHIVNMNSYNSDKQNLFRILSNSKSCQGVPGTQNLENLPQDQLCNWAVELCEGILYN